MFNLFFLRHESLLNTSTLNLLFFHTQWFSSRELSFYKLYFLTIFGFKLYISEYWERTNTTWKKLFW